jgi:hypothetical protein
MEMSWFLHIRPRKISVVRSDLLDQLYPCGKLADRQLRPESHFLLRGQMSAGFLSTQTEGHSRGMEEEDVNITGFSEFTLNLGHSFRHIDKSF